MRATGPQDCAFPPHPDPGPGGQTPAGGEWRDGGLLTRIGEWRRESPLSRSVPLAAPFAWGAAEIMNAAHVSGVWPGLVTGGAVVVGAWRGNAHFRRDETRLSGGEAALALGAAGGWVTGATVAGPLAGGLPWWWTISGAGLAWCLTGWLARHRGITTRHERAARSAATAAAFDADKRWWNTEIAPLLDLNDYYLLKPPAKTLLGRELLIGTSPTGKTARTVYAGHTHMTDRLLAYLGLEFGAADFEIDGPTRLRVKIRYGDPWAAPIWHPALDPTSPYRDRCPDRSTITKPVCIGIDPETGQSMLITLWDQRGAKRVGIFATTDGGKTTALDSLKAGITACDDARLLQINLSKAIEDRWWAELADANALDTDIGRAFGILRFLVDGIRERPRRGGRRDKVHRPTRREPLYVVSVDEVDAAIEADPVRANRLLGLICSKGRSEGFAVIIAGQRAIQAAVGGGQVKMNLHTVIWGKFVNMAELANVFGRENMPPDLSEYGAGHPGVFGITTVPHRGEYQRGRTFYWGEDCTGHEKLVAQRRQWRSELPGLEPALAALAPQWARIRAHGEYDWRGDPEYAEDGTAPGDVVETAAGELVPGTRAVKERIERARAAADQGGDLTPLDPEAERRLAARIEAEHDRWAQTYANVKLEPRDAELILGLAAEHDVISAGDAATAIRKSRATAHRYLHKLVSVGQLEVVEARDGNQGGFRTPRHLRLVERREQ